MNKKITIGLTGITIGLYCLTAQASSHMDAPLITLDPAANTTDVYAFRTNQGDEKYLTTALSVYPFEEPGIGPNNYRFDDNVLYEIHIALGDDVAAGRKTLSYQFRFHTHYKNKNTILQAYLGPLIGDKDDTGFDVNQNIRQTYVVTRVDYRHSDRNDSGSYHSQGKKGKKTILGKGRVPPNNQGLITAFYNRDDNGENIAKGGESEFHHLDRYTQDAITDLQEDYQAFAGQRDDGFYADIQSIFDLDFTFGGDNKPFDSQGGFNVHTIVLNIPLYELGDDAKIVGVYATTSRQRKTILRGKKGNRNFARWVQVGRQGNPLFNEAFLPIHDKDLFNHTSPERDKELFETHALNPELAAVLGLKATDRTDIAGIFIPDLIKVDVTTGPARLAGTTNDEGFNRLSVFGGDTLLNQYSEDVPGGFPNGRRFGDDVVDVALLALIGDLLPPEAAKGAADDGVRKNDISFNKTFPYAATPHNGRNHVHH
jgi:uncharacterized protein DUF4331